MKYERNAEAMHFFNFVFYETDERAKKMYIHCPNCKHEYTVELTKKHNITWQKRNYRPCECFRCSGVQPEYKLSHYAYEGLSNYISVGEFSKENGIAVLNVYRHQADFGASNYKPYVYPFKRNPIFTKQKIIKITFNPDKVRYDTCLYFSMCCRTPHIGGWIESKSWRPSSFVFDIIPESFSELKGTDLEPYIGEIDKFQQYIELRNSITNIPVTEASAMFLIQNHTSFAFRKLWNAGYYNIAYDRVVDKVSPHNPYLTYYLSRSNGPCCINWRGKTLESILGVEPSKFDVVIPRSDLFTSELYGVQLLSKLGVSITGDNLEIILANGFDEIKTIYEQVSCPIKKMFKYIRNQTSKSFERLGVAVKFYYDYLDTLRKLHIPYTPDVVFPTSLKRAHDRVTRVWLNFQHEVSAKRKSKAVPHMNVAFVDAVKPWSDVNYSSEKYSIAPIDSVAKLINEASKMHNCSAGYIDRIVSKKCVLFMIREVAHPRTPFCMLELRIINSLAIVQCRGVGNSSVHSTVTDFCEQWFKDVVIPFVAQNKLLV